MNKEIVVYIDITEFVNTRINTGIQRVIKEFLQRAVSDTYKTNIIYYDTYKNNYQLLDNDEVKHFLQEIKTYTFSIFKNIDLYNDLEKNKIFLDIDSVWNTQIKRIDLYKKLKQFNYKIVNFIYDLTPILLPNFAKKNTKNNFPSYLSAVLKYSDLVFCDSNSAKDDFNSFKEKSQKNLRCISTKVVYLGSDFLINKALTNSNHNYILNKKYILFVGTIEPRKHQSLVLEAFEDMYEQYPDLNLVFIGKVGWKTEKFIEYINTHSLKDKNVYHLTNVDDYALSLFYKNAFLVTYLSEYEGYGLPIAESLKYGNITITSKNSSMYEVGKKYADYVLKNTKKELVEIILLYLENKEMYDNKKKFIKQQYIPPTWDGFYISFIEELSLI